MFKRMLPESISV